MNIKHRTIEKLTLKHYTNDVILNYEVIDEIF